MAFHHSSEPGPSAIRGDSETANTDQYQHVNKKKTSSHETGSEIPSISPTPHFTIQSVLTETLHSPSDIDERRLDSVSPHHFDRTQNISEDHQPSLPTYSEDITLSHLRPGSNQTSPSDQQSGIYLHTPQWPMKNDQEAMLFRYFIDTLAPRFDLCDDERHFAKAVPRQAVFCPTLLNAIMAVSAKQLSRTNTSSDSLIVDYYHQKCLDVLIPELSNSAAIMDTNLLAAIVILRYMEEIDVPITNAPPEFHLLGTRVFVAAQRQTSGAFGLWRAAFLVALRQEIYLALTQTRPIHANFVLEGLCDLLPHDDNGCRYANLMIIQCASCIRYCYNPDSNSAEVWKSLVGAQQRLWEQRPWMFRPLYAEESRDGVLPSEQYLNDAVVTGIQYYHLAQIIMAAHNPNIPKLGPGHLVTTREINDEIKKTVRIICGIAKVINLLHNAAFRGNLLKIGSVANKPRTVYHA